MNVCARCGKGSRTVVTRSHSMIATKRRQRPNLQRARYDGRRAWLCTSCIGVITREEKVPATPKP